MGRFDGILICSDFDGTLACGSVISAENAEAVRYFQKEGGLFTLATGRSHHHFASYQDVFAPNAPMLCYNGSIMYDPITDKILYEGHIEPTIHDDMTEILRLTPEIVDISFCKNGSDYWTKAVDYSAEAVKAKVPASQILKVITRIETEDYDGVAARVTEAFSSRYGVYRSWFSGIEIQSLHDTKGQGILRVKDHLGDRVKTVIAVGDYENDIPMFDVADISYAPANAHPNAKARATHITVGCEDGAIAKIISEL
ncbi:MAG: HAD-IIB family hydrolase [Clostridia bacterium]|nr:HAD-IIB family hydrolase [Clostridia bacterium]